MKVWCGVSGAVRLSVWTCGHIPNETHWMNEPVVAREPRPAMCMCMNAAHRPDWARWCEWGPSSSSSRLSQWRTVLKGQQPWRDWDPVRTSAAAAAHWQTVSIHSPDSPPPPLTLPSAQQMLWRAPWWWSGILPAAPTRDATSAGRRAAGRRATRRVHVETQQRWRIWGFQGVCAVKVWERTANFFIKRDELH